MDSLQSRSSTTALPELSLIDPSPWRSVFWKQQYLCGTRTIYLSYRQKSPVVKFLWPSVCAIETSQRCKRTFRGICKGSYPVHEAWDSLQRSFNLFKGSSGMWKAPRAPRKWEKELPTTVRVLLPFFKASGNCVQNLMKQKSCTMKRAFGYTYFMSGEVVQEYRQELKHHLAIITIDKLYSREEVSVLYQYLTARAVHGKDGRSSFIRVNS